MNVIRSYKIYLKIRFTDQGYISMTHRLVLGLVLGLLLGLVLG